MDKKISIFWFRRDLRLDDNLGLCQALNDDCPVMPLFIFDQEILDKLPRDDARVSFIYETLQNLRKQLQENYGSSLAVYHGSPEAIFKKLVKDYQIQCVFANHDYEPYALTRDTTIKKLLGENNIDFQTFKDQVIFEKNEVVKDTGDPYVVYTPYMKKWREKFRSVGPLYEYPSEKLLDNLIPDCNFLDITLSQMGFVPSEIKVPQYTVSPFLIQNYEATRNFPANEKGTSRLGPHLRFGTVSIRKMVKRAMVEKNQVFLNELIWREFFMQILWHYPKTAHQAFKPKYDRIQWRNKEEEFEKWKNGNTGYKLVDAGMRELNQTGYMHNRVRMLTASFLCKHLLIDWRWGEAYFAEKLLDYEMSSNVGNWQWASGSGVDAAPYFRIFNPMTQVEKFDKDKTYISQWVPDYLNDTYPRKMVDHKEARERCLKVYKEALG
ncbi:MAG: deoxyribodipyrimidine photo-lyase [Bacteroidota bacterium]